MHRRVYRLKLDQFTPDEELPSSLYEHIYELDALLWAERGTFLLVAGKEELQHARRGQGSPRSHWWWYVDELQVPPEPVKEQHEHLARAFTPADG
jgi:hypothetical protein